MKNKLLALVLTVLAMGCLQTRANLRKDPSAGTSKESTITPKQQKAAEEVVKQEETNKEFRELYGRIESVENQMGQLKESEKVKSLEARIVQMETEMNLLRATVSELNAKAKKEPLMSSDARETMQHKSVEKNELSEAGKLFESKKWEDAILAYEEYRKNNPKGKSYSEATLKIGLCFQNLNLKDDAKVFFKEVVEKYPKSKDAETAKARLKKL